jgi:hypothetical protein
MSRLRSPREGTIFKNRAEVLQQFGGTRQKGISYRTTSSHAVLVSDGRGGAQERVYGDRWVTRDVFEYFGEWRGCRSMEVVGGNLTLIARSPNLHLVVADETGFVYQGRFQFIRHRHQQHVRKACGHEHDAIVFTLQRATRR